MINSNEGWMDEPKLITNTQVYHNMLGIEKADSGEYEDAINEFTKVLSQNPNDANAYFSRATLKVRIGDIEGARRDFKMSENCRHNNKLELEKYPLI
jgi:Flp pilus assembly protein TadD